MSTSPDVQVHPDHVIETARLSLHPVTPADQDALHAVFTQSGVRRFLFDDKIMSREQTAGIIQKSNDLFRMQRFGLWVARLPAGARRDDPARADAALAVSPPLVGFGAFWYFREPPALELLYGVADPYLKRGFGREIARAIVFYGETALAMDTIHASTDAAHAASRRLLEDLGFRLERQARADAVDTVFYVKTL